MTAPSATPNTAATNVAAPVPEAANGAGSAMLAAMYREHRHLAMLISVLKEQLQTFNIGKTPDYLLMADVIDYMKDFPTRFEHPRRQLLCQRLLDRLGTDTELEMLMAEDEQLIIGLAEVQSTLAILQRDNSLLKQEQLKIFCNTLIDNLERHIRQEAQSVFPKARKLLTAQDWNDIQNAGFTTDHATDPLFGQRVEERYRKLSDYLSARMERAADELAVAEFIGMGAIFDSIEPLSKGLDEIGGVIKGHARELLARNVACYRSLLKERQARSLDYLAKPLDCLLDSYDLYVDGLLKVGRILRKTRLEVSEPYATRMSLVENDVSIAPNVVTTKKRRRR